MSHYWCMGCSGRHSEIQTMWLEKTAHVLSTTKCSSIEVNKKMEISSGTSTRWPFVHCFRIELEFGKCWFFVEGRKQENSGKTLGARNRTNNKLAPQGPRVRDSKLGHIDDRQALSPLRHPCCGRFHLACRIRLVHGPLRQAFGRKFEGSNSDEQYIYFTYRYCSVCKPIPSP